MAIYEAGMVDGIDFEAAYTVDGYRGVAWRLNGFAQEWEADVVLFVDDEGNEWTDVDPHGGGEWVADRSRVVAVMIGDDRKFTFDRDEVHAIAEDEFCHGCGQTGCTAEVWS